MWGVRGRALSHPRLPALWAGCRGGCGASGVGRSPTPDCPPSGRAAGAGVGRPGSGALPPPTARPLGMLPGPVWGVRGLTLSHPRLPALWVGCRGRCGASGVGRSPIPNCPPSERAAGAGVGRPGSGALPPPTARPLGGLPGPVWGVRGRTLSHPRLPALWAGCRGRCGASGVGRSPTPDCPPSGRAAGAGVGRPGSGALPPPTARPLGGLPGPVWGVRGRALSQPRLPALWAGCRGRCGASGVGRSPTPDCPPSGGAAGAGVGRPGSGALPPPIARPLSGLPGPVSGVRGQTLSHPRLPALWAGCRAAVRVRALLGRVGRAGLPGAFWCASPFLWPFLQRSLLVRPPPGWGCPVCGCCSVFFACFPGPGALGLGVLFHPPPLVFFFLPPSPPAPLSPPLPRALASCCPPPPFFVFFVLLAPSPPSQLASAPPPPFFVFFSLSCSFFPRCASAVYVLGCRAVCSLSCPFVVLCLSSVLFLVAGVVGSWCRCLVLGVCWCLVARRCRLVVCVGSGARVWSGRRWASSLWRPVPLCCVLWRCAAVWCCVLVPCLLFFFFSSLLVALVSRCSPLVLGSRPIPGRFCFCALPVRCCAGVPAPLLSVRCSLALAGLAGVLCCCVLCLCVCCWAWLSSVVSWWVLVAPGVVSRWRAVVCSLVLCCAVLLRVVPLGVALLCAVLFRFAPFGAACRALCCVLGRCPSSWGPVPSGAVFCLVPPRCVCFAVVCRCVALFAVVLCAVCALGCPVLRFLSPPPCAVLLCRPLSLGALLPRAVPCGAVLPRGAVVSCPAALLGLFLAWVWLYLLEKPLQNFVKYFFSSFFGFSKLKKIIHDPTHSRAARPCSLLCLTCYPPFLMFSALFLCVASWSVLVSIAKG